MKSLEELREMLVAELDAHIPNIVNFPANVRYYNELMGNISFLLVGILELHLKEQYEDWHTLKWMDDALLTKVILYNDYLVISGIAIWGMGPSQWTEPFYFEMALDKGELNSSGYTFLLGDHDREAVPYEYFNYHRDYWNGWERDWKYRITIE